ncbi:MAG TPA: hypothetical protein VMS08_00855 [Candidatus Saccharimonadia bacterium]|nr:hypothetical protein [Candidatus Saccharimonadia bacterium]
MVEKIREILTATPRRRTLTLFIGVGLLFGLITWFYMGQALSDCKTAMLTDVPGDATAGLTWLTWLDKASPLPGFEHLTNAPFGESQLQPFQITSIFTIPTMWLLSKLTSPTCSWNLMVFLGYMSSALVMFAFIRWLTRNPWVALFAGFAITYTPYHQLNALGHLSYMFNAVLVLFIWSFFAFWRKPTVARAAIMALATASSVYLDGYFIMLGGVLAGSVLLTALLVDYFVFKHPRKYTWARVRGLLFYGLFFAICLTPIVLVEHYYSHTINTALSSSRNDINDETRTYSARAKEYLLPAANDPLLPASFAKYREKPSVLHGSNFTEDTIYVGVVVLALALFGWIWLIVNRKRSESLRELPVLFIVLVLSGGLLAGFATSLQPHVYFFGHRIPTPSDIIIHLTSMWRVFARLYLVVETCLVAIASIGLYLLIRHWSTKRQIATVIVIIILVGLDFASASRARIWKFSWVPNVYSWLSTQSQVHTIAEYPLGEPPSQSISDYLTYQQVSGKAMINTSSSDSPERQLHLSIEGLADAQTIPVLRALGAQLVLEHHQKAGSISGLTFLRFDRAHFNTSPNQAYDAVWTYRIDPGPVAAYVAIADLGFHDPVLSTTLHSEIGMGSHGVLTLQRLGKAKSNSVQVSLSADAESGAKIVTFSQHGIVRWKGQVTTGTPIQFNANPGVPIDIIPSQSNSYESIQIYDLQASL